MHVITPGRLRVFAAAHPDATGPLEAWYRDARKARWESFDDVRTTYGRRVGRYKGLIIFDIGGNKYRLIAAIHYNRRKVFIRHVLTHADYSRDDWKDD
jgi:mRNA interferase HigB